MLICDSYTPHNSNSYKKMKVDDNLNTINNYKNIKFNTLAQDTVAFSGKNVANNVYWQDFCHQFDKKFPDCSIEDVLKKSFMDINNRLGKGENKIVFNIPNMDDYVGAYLKRTVSNEASNEASKLKAVFNPYPKYYFGQHLAESDNFVLMKRIPGEHHSVTGGYQKFITNSLAPEDATIFMGKLKVIEAFPVESYVDLAEQLKYLNGKNARIDIMSPNNIMYDKSKKTFQIIDLHADQEMFASLKPLKNSVSDLKCLLLDVLCYKKYLSLLGDHDVSEVIKLSKSIFDKINKSAKIANLAEDTSVTKKYFDILNKKIIDRSGINPQLENIYDDFSTWTSSYQN